jgi:hypothetical protein
MSLLSSFFNNHLLKTLEQELASHEPQLQAFFLKEIKVLALSVIKWIESKMGEENEKGK